MLVAWVFGFGAAAAWLARLRDRLPLVWAIYGAILGPVALFLLWIAPPGRCAVCRAPVRGWLTTCQWCGMDVRGRVTEPVTVPAAPRTRREVPEPAAPVAVMAAAGAAAGAEPADQPSATAKPAKRPRAARTSKAKAKAATVTPQADVAAAVAASAAAAAADAPSAAAPPADTPPPARPAAPVVAAPPAAAAAPARKATTVLASGVFVTGTVGLSAGSRYDIETDGVDLRVVGTGEKGKRTVAFERKLPGIDATGVEGRLIISASGGRGATVLVFMSIDGGPVAVAEAIARAVRDAGAPA